MEMDCLEMVNLLNTCHNSRFVVAPILLEIGELSVNFSHFVIQHVPRAANQSAHLCAKFACTLMETTSCIGTSREFMVIGLQADWAGSVLVE
jgi:hypothetical protein